MGRRKGFTLVELSIVLVIIGLLIGGILVAQSMIRTAKMESFVRQIQQIDAAVSNFKTKFKYLPGDSPLHSSTGNGDGLIDPGMDVGEQSLFWTQLQSDGFMSSGPVFQAGCCAANKLGVNEPVAAYGKGADGPAGIEVVSNASLPYKNYYFVCSTVNHPGLGGGDGSWYGVPAFTPVDAVAIDQKMDDGLTGDAAGGPYNLDVTYTGTVSGFNWLEGGLAQCNNGGGDLTHYRTGYTTEDCCFFVAIMGTVGQAGQ